MTTDILSDRVEYQCKENLFLYDSPKCEKLATQAARGRHLRLHPPDLHTDSDRQPAIQVELCEDDYPGWLATTDLDRIEPAQQPYIRKEISLELIRDRLPQVIAFTQQAMETPNQYLWGGTVGPDYDCSGLMQAAFASVGIWIPRDAYQQQAFAQALPLFAIASTEPGSTHRILAGVNTDKPSDVATDTPKLLSEIHQTQGNYREIVLSYLQAGDLVFFGLGDKATHVGLYLGDGLYIHSSGTDRGRNGIGVDVLSEQGHPVSKTYYQQLQGAGRIVASY
ncbi:MAG: C40 family peptidase [Microcoleaceae cyanobacterium]